MAAPPGESSGLSAFLDDAVEMGLELPPELAAMAEDEEEAGEGVWPENAEAVSAFLRVCNQWRVTEGMGGRLWIGLDYAAARDGLDAAAIAVTPDLWAALQLVEAGATRALNEGAET
ncbi:DUF1799 domain-containing protein [Pseudoroseicyclus sp. H15]